MDKQGNIKIRVMKKVMQEENVINNMKIIRFKIRRYKNGYSQGVLVECGNKWNLININEVDYVLNGYQFTNKSFIEDESQISESTLLYKILSHKADISNNLYHIAPHILDNTEQLCEYLLNCGVLIGVGLHKSDVIYVGKIREITATSFLLNSYDTELSESGIKRIDFEKIRYIQIHTDYLDSLSMIL